MAPGFFTSAMVLNIQRDFIAGYLKPEVLQTCHTH